LVTAARKIELISIEDYLEGELRSQVKHEYLGGTIYAMAGARNVHNQISVRLVGLWDAQLRGRPCQPFNSDTKVRVRLPTHTRFYYPDGMIVCQSNPPEDSFQDNPVVIAEVISDATRRIDEGEKRDAYLAIASLLAYLLIETDRPRVVVYRRTETGFVPEAYEGLEAIIPLKDVGCSIAVAELYERVEFPDPAERGEGPL
jgi:Uma2 family endonuclease